MGEMNSIACGGQAGVSDAFGSALWALDTMFEYAKLGVTGVNLHNGNGGAYAVFSFNIQNGTATTYSIQSIRPLYYGLLLFTEAAPAGSQLLPVALSTTANLKAWATLDSSGNVRLLLINKDTTAIGLVEVQLAGYSTAVVTRLTAPTYQSSTGLTLAGQTFDNSTDGTPLGTAYAEFVTPVAGTYSVALPPTTAVLLTVGK
jgi:hypothetical protein